MGSETDFERHLNEVLSAPEFASAPVLSRTLETLVNAKREQKELSVWDLADRLYPDAGEHAYNRTKANVSKLRKTLNAYYEARERSSRIRMRIPSGRYQIEIDELPEQPHEPSRRWIAVAVLAVLIAMALVYWLWPSPATQMADVVIDGNRVAVLDDDGRTLFERTLDAEPFAPGDSDVGEPYLLDDIDDDGVKDLLLIAPVGPNDSESSQLHRITASDKTLWEFDLSCDLSAYPRPLGNKFGGVIVDTLELDGRPVIIAVGEHISAHPSTLNIIDAATGDLVGQYLHPGRISGYLKADFNRDGDLEVLVTGRNNPDDGSGYPFLALLDLPIPDASEGPIGFFDMREARVLKYLLLPRPVSMKREKYWQAVYPRLHSPGHILVHVGFDQTDDYVEYIFDLDLGVVRVDLPDKFPWEYDRVYYERALYFDRAPNANHPLITALFDPKRTINNSASNPLLADRFPGQYLSSYADTIAPHPTPQQ